MNQNPTPDVIKIYGIKNCSSMKKAFDWLDANGIAYEFHDYKKLGIDGETIRAWCADASWQKLLNTQGLTWRGLDPAEKQDVDATKAIVLMVAKPSLIKRPVITGGKRIVVGFDEETLSTALKD
ncbi:arsenate reductase [Niveibacterium sp. 24ML]|uniref:arsenate reductase n=1 Tax=Niveibacterium sp. 24ML TaxID=2985512 RepID=UPI0022702C1C|nr:arsenate reductase [Niveibacterium sp. 24ML]MCX9158447.1 arsenate reductase [Niveibacterium sp. 24ML]